MRILKPHLKKFIAYSLPMPVYLYIRYYKKFGRVPFPGRERTFNDHILKLMTGKHDPRRIVFGDKLKTRDYVAERLGEGALPKIFQVSRDPNDIDPQRLPDSFVLKSSHGCGAVKIVLDKTAVNWPEVRQQMQAWIADNYYYKSGEYVYANPDPKIFVEELLLHEPGRLCFDYKFFCFNGEPKLIHVIVDRSPSELLKRKHIFFHPTWERIDMNWGTPIADEIPKPDCLDELIETARALSTGFHFLRVDLYVRNSQVIVGELTNFPESGLAQMVPIERDAWLGSFFRANV